MRSDKAGCTVTAVCNGGTSSSKPGFNLTTIVGSTSVESALLLLGFTTFAEVIAPLIGGITFELTTFCSVDPPPDPGLTAQDLIDVLNFADPTVSIPAIDKAKQWFEHYYWCQICKCDNGVIPTCTPLSNPGNISVNPGLPGQPNSACFNGSVTETINSSSAGTTIHDLTGQLLPTAGTPMTCTNINLGAATGLSVLVYPIPAEVQRIDFTSQGISADPAPLGSGHLSLDWVSTNASCVQQNDQGINTSPSQPPGTVSVFRGVHQSWEAAATHYAVVSHAVHQSNNTAKDETVFVKTNLVCQGQAIIQPCCPPDTQIMNKLAQITGLLNTLISNQPKALRAYTEGTVHTHLTGNGTVLVNSLTVAIKVTVTSLPSYIGQELGSPPILFEAGFITPANTEGPTEPLRLQFSTQVFQMPLLPVAVDFSLPPLLEIEITELSATA